MPFAQSLQKLGSTDAWIVHGSDGLDEVTITGETYCAQLKDGEINEFLIHPSDINLPTARLSDIIGGEPEENAKEIINKIIKIIFLSENRRVQKCCVKEENQIAWPNFKRKIFSGEQKL